MLLADLDLFDTHAELIAHVVADVNRHLDRQQRFYLLWADVDNHIAASHLAESLGDNALVERHLQTVSQILAEIYQEYPRNRENLSFWFPQ